MGVVIKAELASLLVVQMQAMTLRQHTGCRAGAGAGAEARAGAGAGQGRAERADIKKFLHCLCL